jgi:hypothetical protein
MRRLETGPDEPHRAFSVAMELIADLDRPQEGTLRVSPQARIDLRQSMR